MTNLPMHCTLCPRMCGANRAGGEAGQCGADDSLQVARAALHPWEEPVIAGKNGSGTVFFSHCSLQCVYCQNRAISRQEAAGIALSPAALARTFLSLQTQGAHNINLVTAAHYAPQVCEALASAKEQGLTLPIVYNTGGYEKVNTLRMLDGLIDIYLPDYKYYSSYYAAQYSQAEDYRETATEAIAEMVRQTGPPVFDGQGLMLRGVLIRHLMLPGLAGDTAQILRDISIRFGDSVLVSLMRQYTPFDMAAYPELNRTITDPEYAAACEQFSAFGLVGFFQQGEAIGQSFIPVFDGFGVECDR